MKPRCCPEPAAAPPAPCTRQRLGPGGHGTVGEGDAREPRGCCQDPQAAQRLHPRRHLAPVSPAARAHGPPARHLHLAPHLPLPRPLPQKDGELCLAMPRYPTSLADCIAQAGSGGLQLPWALALSLDMARGLEELHGQGVVAGSLKPHNVLLTAQGVAVLNDLGLGQAISHTHAEAMAMRLAWTYNYLAPEQIEEGGCVGSKSDVWAWACTLIHMLTGQAPMADLRRMQIIRKVSGAREAPAVPPGLPPWLTQLLNSCLEFDPNSRPTAAVVCKALGESHADQAVSPGATALITITMRDLMGGEVLFRLSPLVKLHKLMAAYHLKKRGGKAVDVNYSQAQFCESRVSLPFCFSAGGLMPRTPGCH